MSISNDQQHRDGQKIAANIQVYHWSLHRVGLCARLHLRIRHPYPRGNSSINRCADRFIPGRLLDSGKRAASRRWLVPPWRQVVVLESTLRRMMVIIKIRREVVRRSERARGEFEGYVFVFLVPVNSALQSHRPDRTDSLWSSLFRRFRGEI